MAHNADALHCSLPVRVVLFTRMFTPKKPQKPKLLAGSNKARAKHAECGCVDGSNNHGMAWCMAWYPTKLNWTEQVGLNVPYQTMQLVRAARGQGLIIDSVAPLLEGGPLRGMVEVCTVHFGNFFFE